MGKPHLAHKIVGLEGGLQVFLVDANRAAHQHMLGSFSGFVIDFEEVAALESLKTEEVVVVIAGIIDFSVNFVRVLHNVVVSPLAQQWSGSSSLVFE